MEQILMLLQQELQKISYIKEVRTEFPETVTKLPSVVILPREGRIELNGGWLRKFHIIDIFCIISRTMAVNGNIARNLIADVSSALLNFAEQKEISGDISYEFGSVTWGNDTFFSLQFHITVKEI